MSSVCYSAAFLFATLRVILLQFLLDTWYERNVDKRVTASAPICKHISTAVSHLIWFAGISPNPLATLIPNGKIKKQDVESNVFEEIPDTKFEDNVGGELHL